MSDVQSIPFQELGEPERTLNVGDTVWDDLMDREAKVVRIHVTPKGTKTGNSIAAYDLVGIWLDSEWLGGGRHPWEISMVPHPSVMAPADRPLADDEYLGDGHAYDANLAPYKRQFSKEAKP